MHNLQFFILFTKSYIIENIDLFTKLPNMVGYILVRWHIPSSLFIGVPPSSIQALGMLKCKAYKFASAHAIAEKNKDVKNK